MSLVSHQGIFSSARWLCLVLLALILSFGLSWLVLLPFDFGYQWLYQLIGIDQHIAEFGPANVLKQGFEFTTEAERFRLFSAIVTSIHNDGFGLDTLLYHNAQGVTLNKLLTHDEVVHLHDVAILIDNMRILLIVSGALFIALLLWIYFSARSLPTFHSMLLAVMSFLSLVIGLVLLIGPHNVFYTLHLWVFPEEHKWFFYYEESLMSTMMKAPDLFAYIAILLLLVALPIFVLIIWLVRRLLTARVTALQG